jgi:hypothetical protein
VTTPPLDHQGPSAEVAGARLVGDGPGDIQRLPGRRVELDALVALDEQTGAKTLAVAAAKAARAAGDATRAERAALDHEGAPLLDENSAARAQTAAAAVGGSVAAAKAARTRIARAALAG